MKKRLLILLLIGVSAIASSLVSAGCMYGDYEYPTGTVIGGLTCQGDGSWK